MRYLRQGRRERETNVSRREVVRRESEKHMKVSREGSKEGKCDKSKVRCRCEVLRKRIWRKGSDAAEEEEGGLVT